MIGFSDLIADRNYTTSVKCTSHKGSVLEIKAEEFKQRLRNDTQTWNFLTQYSKDRDKDDLSHIKAVTKNYNAFKKNDFDKNVSSSKVVTWNSKPVA